MPVQLGPADFRSNAAIPGPLTLFISPRITRIDRKSEERRAERNGLLVILNNPVSLFVCFVG
jgi:hypothetical protein